MRHIVLLLLTIAVAHASVTVTRSSKDGPHPSEMEIEVQLPYTNKMARIPLTKTEAFENLPMTVLENGVSRTFSAHQVHHANHAHYRDIESKSVISVRHVNGKKRISGHVMHEGTSYFLEPVGESKHSVTRNVMKSDAIAKDIDSKKVLKAMSRKKRQSLSSATTTNTIEIMLLIDHTVWNAFKEIFSDDDTALTELHYYYTHIMNGLDTTYRNIAAPSISVKCIQIVLSKSAADSTWLPPAGSADAIQAGAILGSMKTYSVGKTGDHVMAFTRTDIKSGTNAAVCGMAYTSGVCTESRQSINEDQGLHSWGTASHELAHNLGSEHDSDGNTCDVGKKNIMSPSSGFYTLSDIGNSYRFSSCSISYMKNYIDGLGSSSCMRSTQGTAATDVASTVVEGARMTLDQVCKLSYPSSPGKFYLTDDVSANPALICAKIYCTPTAGSTSGTTTGGLRAPAGTPCGNKKSCNWQGQCSADSSAPEADEACFWGDSWGDGCAGWVNYVKYLRDASDTTNAKVYCGQALPGCCKSLKTLCTF